MLSDHHREARRTAIVRLLRHSPVRRQQELVRLLKREGHAVTQSSISRDLRELGVLKPRGRQRSDSTHVLAAVRDLNRLELLAETLRATLNAPSGVWFSCLTQTSQPISRASSGQAYWGVGGIAA